MREILFRGKDVDTNEWREGYLYVEDAPPTAFLAEGEKLPEPTYWIIFKNPHYLPDWNLPWRYCKANVDPKTVGQFTGLCDKNSAKIFEGDLIKGAGKRVFKIEYCIAIAGYVARACDDDLTTPCVNYGTMLLYEVIGNIHNSKEEKP